jgi:hypothetical protein
MYYAEFLSHRIMKMKSTLLLCSVFLSPFAFSQTTYGIKKVFAYYEERMPGTIAVGEDGRSTKKYPNVEHYVYIETTSKTKIQWKAAWKDGKSFSLSSAEIKEFPFVAGKKKMDMEEIKIQPAKGNKLWKIEFTKDSKTIKPPLKTKEGELLLQGIYNGKKIYKRIAKQTELYSPPSV